MPNWQPEADGVYRNNYFYGGNLRGIIEKVDYIYKMGFDFIYLGPIGKSSTSHHYDPEDQTEIDPWIGTWEDFRELVNVLHLRGMKLVPDLVFNHVGITNKHFQEALNNPYSPKRKWFKFDSAGRPIFWQGFENMPEGNLLDEGYQNYCCDEAEIYIKNGADGVRLDLGENFPKEFMSKLRKRIKAINPEALIVSEMWDFATSRENPQMDGEQVDSVMNYPLADAIIRWVRCGNHHHFIYTWNRIQKYPKQVQDVLWNHIDTHDTPRAENMLVGPGIVEDPFAGGRSWDIEGPWRHPGKDFDTYGFRKWECEHDFECDDVGRAALKLASAIQYFLPGIPVVFAGTEVGVTGYKDPFNRKPYPWNNIDKELYEHYQELGEMRRRYRDFFETAIEFKDEVYPDWMKLSRMNSRGERITLYINRLTKKFKFEIEVYSN